MRHASRLLVATLLSMIFAASAFAAGTSPTWAEASGSEAPTAFKVLQYLDLTPGAGAGANLVILAAGNDSGLVSGTMLKVYRASVTHGGSPVWAQTGKLKVVETQGDVAVAEVEEQGSTLAKAFFPRFPGVMAGDLAVAPRLTLTRRQQVMPTLTLSYFDLFDDPKGQPTSFELKSSGLERLKDAAKAFAGARLSLLMVEGYTDHNGPSNANQVESYQRALTVRQYLIDELGFDEKRVIAVGYGEAEPADATFTPGYVEANRRIVLKAVALPGK